MEPAIRVENLSKLYRVAKGGDRARYATLREAVTNAAAAPLRWVQKGFAPADPAEDFWALKDVSFEVQPGEVVGIIGRNGAGKSTLLKILSRITKPTTGRVTLNGRVGSLLEVGTGFHPELTGRENVYLNGSILGMSRREIAKKFDEIVAFAEVERFLDTPVKRYSSGMYVRLAFAVAAHLEPEILIVDEVLAVGDAEFQKKCLGKMQEVGREGRTVLFVSHNIVALRRLCERGVVLESGRIGADAAIEAAVAYYSGRSDRSTLSVSWEAPGEAPGDDSVRLKSARVSGGVSGSAPHFRIEEPLVVEVEYWNLTSKGRPSVLFHMNNAEGDCLFSTNDFSNRSWWYSNRQVGVVTARCKIPANFLAEGVFSLHIGVGSYNPNCLHVFEEDLLRFEVADLTTGEGVRGPYVGVWPGLLRPQLDWDVTTSN